MKPNKNETRNVALKRIDYLYNLMNSESIVPKSEIVKQIEKLSVRFDITLSNGSRSVKERAEYVSEKAYGDGLIDIMKHFRLLEE